MHLPAVANLSNSYLANIIAETIEMLVNPQDFILTLASVTFTFSAKVGINLVDFTSIP